MPPQSHRLQVPCLQCASRVYTLEPWWNPAVELQAIQRAHRIGQRNAVRAVRFIIESRGLAASVS